MEQQIVHLHLKYLRLKNSLRHLLPHPHLSRLRCLTLITVCRLKVMVCHLRVTVCRLRDMECLHRATVCLRRDMAM